MILYIDTSNNKDIILTLMNGKSIKKAKIKAEFQQCELLLASIDSFLAKNKVKLNDLTEIQVKNTGEGFTSLRIGIVTANALGYALGIPVKGVDKITKRQRNREIEKQINSDARNLQDASLAQNSDARNSAGCEFSAEKQRNKETEKQIFNIVIPKYKKEPNITVKK